MVIIAITINMARINPTALNNLSMVKFKLQSLSAVILGLLCLAVLILAVPRFVASLYALYPESVLSQMPAHLPTDTYLNSIKALDDALTWDDNPEYWQAKGLCFLALLNFSNTSVVQRRLWLIDAKLAISKGLSGSPVDAFAWFRLAVVNKMLNVDAISEDLRLSLYAGRVEPELLMHRLELAYFSSLVLGSDESGLWLKQVNLAWQLTPTKLVAFVIENPYAQEWVESAFVYDVEQLKHFNQAYDNATKKSITTRTH